MIPDAGRPKPIGGRSCRPERDFDAPAFTYPIEVRFRDMDALGHVNNAVYLTYLESARIADWLHVTKRAGLDALDMILARVEIDYRSPLAYGEALDVTVRCASMRRSSFVLEFRATERAADAGGRGAKVWSLR